MLPCQPCRKGLNSRAQAKWGVQQDRRPCHTGADIHGQVMHKGGLPSTSWGLCVLIHHPGPKLWGGGLPVEGDRRLGGATCQGALLFLSSPVVSLGDTEGEMRREEAQALLPGPCGQARVTLGSTPVVSITLLPMTCVCHALLHVLQGPGLRTAWQQGERCSMLDALYQLQAGLGSRHDPRGHGTGLRSLPQLLKSPGAGRGGFRSSPNPVTRLLIGSSRIVHPGTSRYSRPPLILHVGVHGSMTMPACCLQILGRYRLQVGMQNARVRHWGTGPSHLHHRMRSERLGRAVPWLRGCRY